MARLFLFLALAQVALGYVPNLVPGENSFPSEDFQFLKELVGLRKFEQCAETYCALSQACTDCIHRFGSVMNLHYSGPAAICTFYHPLVRAEVGPYCIESMKRGHVVVA